MDSWEMSRLRRSIATGETMLRALRAELRDGIGDKTLVERMIEAKEAEVKSLQAQMRAGSRKE